MLVAWRNRTGIAGAPNSFRTAAVMARQERTDRAGQRRI
jgi:hypothetical protein